MDPNLTLWWGFFLSVLVLDVVLWSLALLVDAGPEGRFRLSALAAVLVYVLLGLVLGWGVAAAIWCGGLWLWAIIAGNTETSQPA